MPSNQAFSPVEASRRLILRARFAQQQHADGHKMVRARVYLLSGCFSVSRDAVGPNGQLIVNLIPEVEFINRETAARSRPAAARCAELLPNGVPAIPRRVRQAGAPACVVSRRFAMAGRGVFCDL